MWPSVPIPPDRGSGWDSSGSDQKRGQEKIMWKHGHTNRAGRKTRTYRIWEAMRRRCNDPSFDSYRFYGARGVAVCARWQRFENFLADMGDAPTSMSLDRKDTHGNYDPTNCQWATEKDQQNNRANNNLLTLDGVTLNLTQWSEKTGIARGTLRRRIASGWPTGDVLNRPPGRRASAHQP